MDLRRFYVDFKNFLIFRSYIRDLRFCAIIRTEGGRTMKYIQKMLGYLFLYSAITLLLFPFRQYLILVVYLLLISFVKVIPHPKSHVNPFAFGLRLRSSLMDCQ